MSAAYEIGEEEQHTEGEFSYEERSPTRVEKFDVQELIRQVEENDPRIRDVSIGHKYNNENTWDDIDWERFGAVIGSNTHVTEMSVFIDGLRFSTQQGVQFSRGIALNRSIKKMTVIGEDTLANEKIFLIFSPFFQNNPAIEFLNMQMPIGRIGFGPLVALLLNPRSNLTVLNLSMTLFDDGGVNILSAGLNDNRTLSHLDLGGNPNITQSGWQAIFASLQMPFFSLENLHLWGNDVNDAALLSLSSALRHSTTLKILQLDGSISAREESDSASVIAKAAWRDLFAGVVQSTTCTLECLQLSACNVNDDVLQLLINTIARNDRLREVNLSHNPGVTDAGWEAFSAVLRNPTLMSVLEELDLGLNSINDCAVASFAGPLVANNRLRALDLSNNPFVTPAGWETFSTVLRNPISALEHLHLNNNSINYHALDSFVDALNNNKTLQCFEISGNDDITVAGYEAFVDFLCSTSSIMDTYHSNHTLLHDEWYDGYLDDDDDYDYCVVRHRFCLLFGINRDNSVSQAAWFKIIISHFSGNKINLQPFTAMDSSILPFAIAWMANGEYSGRVEFTRLYRSSTCTLL
jgi:hypothetical protein